MTTSGSSAFNPSVTAMITQAYQLLGVIAEDEAPTGAMYQTAIFQLNAIVTAAQAIGLHVFTEEEGILFLQASTAAGQITGQVRYEIGGPGTNANTADANQWTLLTLSQSAAASATSIHVASIAGVAAGDNIGVILDNNATFWTTVSGTPSGATVSLAAPLPSSASSGNYAIDYTVPIARPLKVPFARLMRFNGMIENPLNIMSRQEYMDLPNKQAPGTPTNFFYVPRVDRGILYIWPAPVTAPFAVRFTWYRALQDFFNPGDTMDFPQEWVSPLLWNLCNDLMPLYETPPARQALIRENMQKYGDLAISYDRESEPIQFGVDYD